MIGAETLGGHHLLPTASFTGSWTEEDEQAELKPLLQYRMLTSTVATLDLLMLKKKNRKKNAN